MLIERIKEQIMRWEGVTSGVHKFGGIEFRIGNREMGHVHGDKLADLPFPLQIRNKLIESVKDDQALIMNIKDKGLIILTGCGHAGIVNTINYAKEVTGIKKIYSVIGGFHLSGQGYEESIPLTIAELKKQDPQYIIPCHCTGWKAANEIINTMPEKFIQTSVGSIFYF